MHTSMNVQAAAGEMGGMTMKMHVAAKRVGECSAKNG